MIIIPARYESIRLDRKAVQFIGNRTMIQHVVRACKAATKDKVIVATDHEMVGNSAKLAGADAVIMTGEHDTGTDRAHEAASILKLPDDEVIINVQGDYPFINPDDIAKLGNHKAVQRGGITTLYKKKYGNEKNDPNVVKAVIDKQGRALYFSRSPIPHPAALHCFFEHVGMYAFTMKTLRRFCEAPQGDLERLENIEHIRALEHGIEVHMVETRFDYLGVNTPRDLKEAQYRYERENPEE
jgi:3-deoxy-manno-octulosonate cytidylyltransferase (CMP-KDO synthetase)